MGLSSPSAASASSSAMPPASFLPPVSANASSGATPGFVAAATAQLNSSGTNASWTSSTNASVSMDPNQNNGVMRPRGASGESDSRQMFGGAAASAAGMKYGSSDPFTSNNLNLNDGPHYANVNVAVKRSYEAPEYANVNVFGGGGGDAMLRNAAGSAAAGGLARYSMDLERATERKPSAGVGGSGTVGALLASTSASSAASSQALLERSRAAAQSSPGPAPLGSSMTTAPGRSPAASNAAGALAADAQAGSRKASATEKKPDNVRQALAKQVSLRPRSRYELREANTSELSLLL